MSALPANVLDVTVDYKFPDVWTEADLESLPDDGHRYEILDGCLHMTPLNDGYHQIAVRNLQFALNDAAPEGSEVLYTIGVRVPGGNLIPDIVAFRPHSSFTVWHEADSISLVVEVASQASDIFDRSAKVLKYAEAGIPSYWRVERDGTLIVHELDGAEYTTVATVAPGERWTAERPFPVTVDPAALLPD